MCTGGDIASLTDELYASTTALPHTAAHRNEDQEYSTEGSEDVDEQPEESEGDDSSSSAGASDLEGIPLASDSLQHEAEPSEPKRSKPGTAQSITEEGAASKIGIVFSRILEKRAKQGVLSVRTMSLEQHACCCSLHC